MLVPIPGLTVVQVGGSSVTDRGGRYVFLGGTAATALDGPYVDVVDACGTPPSAISLSNGFITLGKSLAPGDCVPAVLSNTTKAARTAFYYTDISRLLAKKWLPANTWLDTQALVTVNTDDSCRVGWNGTSIVLSRSGDGCANTGTLPDLVASAYRYALDANNASPGVTDAATAIGLGDAFAVALSHDQCVGPGFYVSGTGGETSACPSALRDVARVVSVFSVEAVCPGPGTGVFGGAAECESHLISGAFWDLAGLLVARHGTEEGWNLYEKLLLRGSDSVTQGYTPDTDGRAGCKPGGLYLNVLAADDDNANLDDGTPNADLIYQAFNGHGIACPSPAPTRNQTKCLQMPPVSADIFIPGGLSMPVGWLTYPGATGYRVYRRVPADRSKPYVPIGGQLPAGTNGYTDREILEGVAYQYQVVALVGECVSPFSNTVVGDITKGDGFAPQNPTSVSSPSHALSTWSTDDTVTVQWSGASDIFWDSGVAGYSFEWSNDPTTVPDNLEDVHASISQITSSPLEHGRAYWFHLRTVDGVGNWNSSAVHLGPFLIGDGSAGDVIPPTNPTLSSPTYAPAKWTSDDTIGVQWSDAADDSSGVAGYSYVWSTAAGTVPDTVAEPGTATQTVSPPLATNTAHWFHLRTVDAAGNWSPAVHLGPFFVDTSAPSNPTLSGPSNTWSSDDTVVVDWSGAADAGSGISGYSYAWSTDPETVPDTSKDANASAAQATSSGLSDGMHWFHLRTVDAAGSWSDAVHLGPFLVDSLSPAASITTTLPRWSKALAIPLAWQGADGGSGIAGFDVRAGRFSAGGALVASTTFLDGTTASSGVFAAQPGNIYCFAVEATDLAGNKSSAGAERCTSLPLSNTQLAHSKGWSKRTGAGSYLSSYSQATRKGAVLRATVQAKRLAVVVTKCRGCGKLAVRLDGRLLKTIDLNAKTTHKLQIIEVASFAELRSGTVTLEVVSAGKAVRVEGLGVSRF